MKKLSISLFFLGCLTILTNVKVLAQAPTIASFSPKSAKPGDVVTLTGTNFNTNVANNIVFFGATRATVTASTSTSVTLRVPSGATYAPITLLNAGTSLAAYSLSNFTPTYNPTKTSITTTDFASDVDFTTGDTPISVAIGDIDGDGKPDLVVINAGKVSVLRNTSNSGLIAAGSFSKKVDFPTGESPYSLALGDLNGDGKPDLAVVNRSYMSGSVSVLRNTATSGFIDANSFADKVDFGVGSLPNSVAIGDLDGDGKPDLVVTNYNSNSISVLRNTANSGFINTSSFASKVDFTTGNSPGSVDIGDLDGDNKPDLAVVNYSSNSISVLRNTATSGIITTNSFASKVDFTTGNNPNSVAIGDLDGDGKPDLAVANGGSSSVSVLRNTANTDLLALTISSGILSPAFVTGITTYTATVPIATTSLTLTPTNAAARSTIEVRINEGSYASVTSGSPSGSLALNIGANTIDIKVTAQNGDVNNYTVTVSRALPPTITSFSPKSAKPGDVVTLTGTNFNTNIDNNIVFFGATRATVTAATTTSVTLTVPSGATYAPITLLNTGTSLAAYSLSNFTPTYNPSKTSITTTDFASKVDFETRGKPQSVAIGDLDGDGKPELVVVNYNYYTANDSHSVSVYHNTSNSGLITAGSFASKVDFKTQELPKSVAIGDLNGDGKPDLAVVGDGGISLLRNTSITGLIDANSFADKVVFNTGVYQIISIAIGDIDGDGRPDLAVGNKRFESGTLGTPDAVSVFRNTAPSGPFTASSFAKNVDFITGFSPISIAIGDLDGDGKPDMAVANLLQVSHFNTKYTVSLFRNTATSGVIDANSFATKVDLGTGTNPNAVAISDLDDDGKPDLVVVNRGRNAIAIYHNKAISGVIDANSFAAQRDFSTVSVSESVAISDFNGDGKPDIAVANSFNNVVSVYRNTVTSGVIDGNSFAEKVNFATGTGARSVAIGDLDGDGMPDLAVANNSTSTKSVSVLRNNAVTDLFSLIISSGILSPTFVTGIATYNAIVPIATTSVTLTPTNAAANSTIEVRINAGAYTSVTSGSPSGSLALNIGANFIDVKVTGQTGDVKTYTVTVTRASKNADLSLLTLSSGTLSPAFATATIEYTASVSNEISSITLTPTIADANASVTVNGIAVESSNASGTIALNVGTNTITTIVTAQDGNTTKTYTLIVTRAEAPLPVTLTSFTGALETNGNRLNWTTASEQNNRHFELERSSDDSDFERIATVNGNGTTNVKHFYTFLDRTSPFKTSYYRLKQIDYNGKFEYSGVVAVKTNFSARIIPYPNPFTDDLIIDLPEALKPSTKVYLFDVFGRKQNITFTITGNTIKCKTANLPTGSYALKIVTNTTTYNKMVIKK